MAKGLFKKIFITVLTIITVAETPRQESQEMGLQRAMTATWSLLIFFIKVVNLKAEQEGHSIYPKIV